MVAEEDICGHPAHLLNLEVHIGDVRHVAVEVGVEHVGRTVAVGRPLFVGHAFVAGVVAQAAREVARAHGRRIAGGVADSHPRVRGVVLPLAFVETGKGDLSRGVNSSLEGGSVECYVSIDTGISKRGIGLFGCLYPLCAARVHNVVGIRG